MIGLSAVKSESKSRSERPCGCSVSDCSLNRSTTFTNRSFSSGNVSRRSAVAASASSVATSPAHAITASGSRPSSLLAQSQMPMPFAQCAIAASIGRYWR